MHYPIETILTQVSNYLLPSQSQNQDSILIFLDFLAILDIVSHAHLLEVKSFLGFNNFVFFFSYLSSANIHQSILLKSSTFLGQEVFLCFVSYTSFPMPSLQIIYLQTNSPAISTLPICSILASIFSCPYFAYSFNTPLWATSQWLRLRLNLKKEVLI